MSGREARPIATLIAVAVGLSPLFITAAWYYGDQRGAYEADLARQALLQEARALQQRGQPEQAIRLIEGSGELDRPPRIQSEFQLRVQLARLYKRSGDRERARAQMEAVLAGRPRSGVAATMLGVIAEEEGDAAGAEEYFRRAVASVPGNADFRANLGFLLLRQGRAEDGVRQLERAVAIGEGRPGAYHAGALNVLGVIAAEKGDLAAAEDYFRRAIASGPEAGEPHGNLGFLQLRRGQRQEGMSSLRRAAALGDRRPEVQQALGAGD